MSTTKRWSYRQITEHAEKQIRGSMKLADEAHDDFLRRIHRNFAFGAYQGWFSLTCGWQKPGDDERLAALSGSTLPNTKKREVA